MDELQVPSLSCSPLSVSDSVPKGPLSWSVFRVNRQQKQRPQSRSTAPALTSTPQQSWRGHHRMSVPVCLCILVFRTWKLRKTECQTACFLFEMRLAAVQSWTKARLDFISVTEGAWILCIPNIIYSQFFSELRFKWPLLISCGLNFLILKERRHLLTHQRLEINTSSPCCQQGTCSQVTEDLNWPYFIAGKHLSAFLKFRDIATRIDDFLNS